jgi:hypothetical protein
MLNLKLETLNSLPTGRQTQMSLPTGRQAKHKTQNRMTQKIFASIYEKSELPFEFYILGLFRI